MRLYGKGVLAIAAGAALAGGLTTSTAYGQEWQTAVALGDYAVYSVNRRIDGTADQSEYFIQSFNADGTVRISSYVLKTPPVNGAPLTTLAETLCEGTYTAVPGGQHEATCGDDTYAMLIRRMEVVDGVLVATEMRGSNTARGTAAGEVLEYVYRRLPDGWQDARMHGTYAGYQDAPRAGVYDLTRYFIVNAPAEGHFTWHNAVTNTPGDGTAREIANEPEFIIRDYAQNGLFPGIHQALNIYTGAPTFNWLILDAEMIDGEMVATEIRGFAVGAGPNQWHYIRIGDAREGVTEAAALDATLAPGFGEATLATGFAPQTVEVQAGGEKPVLFAALGADCAGYATAAPTYGLVLTAAGGPLTIAATTAGDGTLIVRDPDGNWLCADDTVDLNPAITLDAAAAGRYDVWVGIWEAGTVIPATLQITGATP